MTNEEAEKRLSDAAKAVGEHFDSVVIIGSWIKDGSTHYASGGTGNHFARTAMARNYAVNDFAVVQAQEIAARIVPPDETESWKQ